MPLVFFDRENTRVSPLSPDQILDAELKKFTIKIIEIIEKSTEKDRQRSERLRSFIVQLATITLLGGFGKSLTIFSSPIIQKSGWAIMGVSSTLVAGRAGYLSLQTTISPIKTAICFIFAALQKLGFKGRLTVTGVGPEPECTSIIERGRVTILNGEDERDAQEGTDTKVSNLYPQYLLFFAANTILGITMSLLAAKVAHVAGSYALSCCGNFKII